MKSVIVQSDLTIIVEKKNPHFGEISKELIKFAEIIKTLDVLFIFKITELSIWSALANNLTEEYILSYLDKISKFPVSQIKERIKQWIAVWGATTLEPFNSENHQLISKNFDELKKIKGFSKLVIEGNLVPKHLRGEIKSLLINAGYPVKDNIGISHGGFLDICINEKVEDRTYLKEAAQAVYSSGDGTVVLPCGGGKTIVGILLMALCKTQTIIITNSDASVKQWKESLLTFTNLREEDIATYDRDNKVIKPVTIVTYSMVAYKQKGVFIHYDRVVNNNWGLMIGDEIHLMPAELFRIPSSLQSAHRMGMTATLIREDGKEKDIFSLIGPKRYDMPWKELEAQKYISSVSLTEIRVKMNKQDKEKYIHAQGSKEKYEIAAIADSKTEVIASLLKKHKGEKILIIGFYTEHLKRIAETFNIPLVYGDTPYSQRDKVYAAMREGSLDVFAASNVANAAVNIPKLSIVIQISFFYGSRSEEGQRVGRASRPKETGAYFYTIVCKDTKEQEYNFNRQQFLTG